MTAAPAWLDDNAREIWDQAMPILSSMKVLTEADWGMFVLLCDAWSEWRSARDTVESTGVSYMTLTGLRKRPEVSVRSDSWRRVRIALIEFGMTPSARARVTKADEDSEEDPLDQFLKGG